MLRREDRKLSGGRARIAMELVLWVEGQTWWCFGPASRGVQWVRARDFPCPRMEKAESVASLLHDFPCVLLNIQGVRTDSHFVSLDLTCVYVKS